MQRRTIQAVLQAHTGRLMALPGVVGTALGECSGEPCIKVFVEKKAAELVERIPPRIEGYPVAVEESGGFRARGPA